MACVNSPYSVKAPKNWEKFTAYTSGGQRLSYQEAQAMFDEYLENMRLENCVENPDVSASVRREPGCSLRATDFDPDGYSGRCAQDSLSGYRQGTGMRILEPEILPEKRFGFDCCWDSFQLALSAGEYAEYTLYNAQPGSTVQVGVTAGTVEAFQDGTCLGEAGESSPAFALETVIRIVGKCGEAILTNLLYR
jgi:hypothetical protein